MVCPFCKHDLAPSEDGHWAVCPICGYSRLFIPFAPVFDRVAGVWHYDRPAPAVGTSLVAHAAA